MQPVILIKLGGSLITDKGRPYTARREIIKRLVKEIKVAKEKSQTAFVIGNGAGSFGHPPAKEYCLLEAKKDSRSLYGVAVTHNAVVELNHMVVLALIKEGVAAVGLAPAGYVLAKRGRVTTIYSKPLWSFVDLSLTPVVFGDVVAGKSGNYSVVSTDTLLVVLARQAREHGFLVERIIHAGNTFGIIDDVGNTIAEITPKNYFLIKGYLAGSAGVDVTGGMAFKVAQGLALARKGIETWIINGEKEGELVKAVVGEKVEGTIIRS